MAERVAGPEIERLIQLLARLPGLGPRSARRAALHLIRKREELLAPLASALNAAHERIVTCGVCGNIDSCDPCTLCRDERRDPSTLIVVESVADLWALERAGVLSARYHVLGGILSPLDGIGPKDLNLASLAGRVAQDHVKEVIRRAQRNRRWADDSALHHQSAGGLQGQDHAARAWRSGRRRTRLSRRRDAHGRDPQPHGVLKLHVSRQTHHDIVTMRALPGAVPPKITHSHMASGGTTQRSNHGKSFRACRTHHVRIPIRQSRFTATLFDWKLEDVEMGPGFTYTMVHVGEGTGGGI